MKTMHGFLTMKTLYQLTPQSTIHTLRVTQLALFSPLLSTSLNKKSRSKLLLVVVIFGGTLFSCTTHPKTTLTTVSTLPQSHFQSNNPMKHQGIHFQSNICSYTCSLFPSSGLTFTLGRRHSSPTASPLPHPTHLQPPPNHPIRNKISLSSFMKGREKSRKPRVPSTLKVSPLQPRSNLSKQMTQLERSVNTTLNHPQYRAKELENPRSCHTTCVASPLTFASNDQSIVLIENHRRPVPKYSNFAQQNRPHLFKSFETPLASTLDTIHLSSTINGARNNTLTKTAPLTPLTKHFNTFDSRLHPLKHHQASTQWSNVTGGNRYQCIEEAYLMSGKKEEVQLVEYEDTVNGSVKKQGMYFRAIESINDCEEPSMDNISQVLSHGFQRDSKLPNDQRSLTSNRFILWGQEEQQVPQPQPQRISVTNSPKVRPTDCWTPRRSVKY